MTTLPYVVGLRDVDRTSIGAVGGKAANLGELLRIEGIRVPNGFCVSTGAYQRAVARTPAFDDLLQRLMLLKAADGPAIRELAARIREVIEGVAVPADIQEAIARALTSLGSQGAFAVRSSATAEDLPGASFAGQQDTFLNVTGTEAVLQHVTRCWASLFTERAVIYRLRGGFDHRRVQMAVVVQKMVFPQASGVLFTADPLSGSRKVASVEATFGLGEALVSGQVNPDIYKVRGGVVVARREAIGPDRRKQPALTDAQVVRISELGRRIEGHFGCPQDIEWCLVDDQLQIVQSRPITTLFPIPAAADRETHVYLSVGHQQMMTDAMKPLGYSLFQLTAARPMFEAGGRLFVDITRALASPAGRAGLLGLAGKHDPLVGDALRTLLDRGDILPADPAEGGVPSVPDGGPGRPPPPAPPAPLESDPAVVEALIGRCQASIAALERDIQGKSGSALLEFILSDIEELKRLLFDPRSTQVFMSAIDATGWLNERLQEWLGEVNAADVLTQSVPHNITSEMGLALLDVADAIRPHPEVVAFLERVEGDGFLDDLPRLDGGQEAREAILSYLDTYGMRCVGEIDITRPRWSERPQTLLPLILGNIKNFEAGAGERRFQEGLREASQKEQELMKRLRALPDGEQRAHETQRMIDRVRTFIGYREYPKYGIVSRYAIYKQALMEEAERLVQARVLAQKDDLFFLTFQELQEVVRTGRVDDQLLRRRRDAFKSYQALTPPRVLTSDGEIFAGAYRRGDLPPNALMGLPVSAGTVEGRARVILEMSEARLEPGDILVTAYTDPSWTPLFVTLKGLVTEVGGLMTHGAVIAREYGLPAVVGVEQATRLIRDGQLIRVHGTEGYVELLSEPAPRVA